MALLNKVFNYQKTGPGVSKITASRNSGFWRIYKSKFFQLLGLNIILCVCIAAVIGIAWIPLNNVLNLGSSYSDTLKNEYNINDSYITVFNRMVDAYKLDETKLDSAIEHFDNSLKLLIDKNPDALNDQMINDGVVGFNSNKFSQNELKYIADEFIAGLNELGFKVNSTTEDYIDGDRWIYTLIDMDDNEVARLTYISMSDKESDKITIEHAFPYSVGKTALIILCFIPLILLGPIRLGITRLTRDYVREEPTFMWSDLWDTIKNNWWQSFVISFVEYVTIGCAIISLVWYYTYLNSGFFFIIGFAGCLFLTYIFVSMNYYVPIMQVTLDLNLRKIYKNAFFFTVICMLKNVWMIFITLMLIIVFALLFIIGMAQPFVLPIVVFVALTVPLAFWIYFISYNTYPSVKKYVIDPYYENRNASNDEEESENDTIIATEQTATVSNKTDASDEELPEYVYHNGRMVHRSILEQEVLFEDDVTNNK